MQQGKPRRIPKRHISGYRSRENYLACQQSLPQATADKLQKALDTMKRNGTHAKFIARYEARIKAQ